MKVLDAFLGVALIIFLILLIVGYDICSLEAVNSDEETMPTNIELYQYKDIVYIYPDSTRATIEDGIFLIKRNRKENKRIIRTESYTVIYTDKNGQINRFKGVDAGFILSRERYINKKMHTLNPTQKLE